MRPFALLAALVLALGGCAIGEAPEDVALAELAAQPALYDGRVLRLRGLVRSFDAPRHYWLEDEYVNRVGLHPAELIAPHLDRRIAVVGRYSFSRERGRQLQIIRIEAYDPPR